MRFYTGGLPLILSAVLQSSIVRGTPSANIYEDSLAFPQVRDSIKVHLNAISIPSSIFPNPLPNSTKLHSPKSLSPPPKPNPSSPIHRRNTPTTRSDSPPALSSAASQPQPPRPPTKPNALSPAQPKPPKPAASLPAGRSLSTRR